jgi:pimeloyl-ACP methyl ester carboxylesterase
MNVIFVRWEGWSPNRGGRDQQGRQELGRRRVIFLQMPNGTFQADGEDAWVQPLPSHRRAARGRAVAARRRPRRTRPGQPSRRAFVIAERSRTLSGKSLLIVGDDDRTIPPRVIDIYSEDLRKSGECKLLRLPGAPHNIHGWAGQSDDNKSVILRAIDDLLWEWMAPVLISGVVYESLTGRVNSWYAAEAGFD